MGNRAVIQVRTASRSRTNRYHDSRAKRVLDIWIAVCLLVISAPILFWAVLANFLITNGHPLFVQKRLGRNGVEFKVFKLRTMRLQKGGEVWLHRTEAGDSRLTLVGTILRRTYIDELPQLFNVLIGNMSMIGPRPETLETTLKIIDTNPRFVERLRVKPGITGAAQVYFRKPTSDQDLWRRYYYDRVYIARGCMRMDLKIALKTAFHITHNQGH